MILNENEAIELAKHLKTKYQGNYYQDTLHPRDFVKVVDVVPYHAAVMQFEGEEKKWVCNYNEIYDVQYGLPHDDWSQSVTREWKVSYILFNEITKLKEFAWAYSNNL